MKFIFSFIVILIFISGCSNNPEEQLSSWTKAKNVKEIINFIQEFDDPKFEYKDSTHLFRSAHYRLLELANDPEAFAFLEKQLFNNKISLEFRSEIFEFICSKIDLNKTIEYMFDNFFELQNNFISEYLFRAPNTFGYYALLLKKNRNPKELLHALYFNRDQYLKNGEIDKLLYSYEMQSNLFSIKRNSKEEAFYSKVKELGNILEPIERDIKSYTFVKDHILFNSVQPEIGNLENEIIELSIAEQKHKPFWINGYIVAFSSNVIGGGEEYEIIRYGYRTHALLITKNVQYKSKGSFSLKVKFSGIREVAVKEEFGGFNQTWDEYTEATKNDEIMYTLLSEKVKDKVLFLKVLKEMLDISESDRLQYCLDKLRLTYNPQKDELITDFVSKYQKEYDDIRTAF